MTAPLVSLLCDRCGREYKAPFIAPLCRICQQAAAPLRTTTPAELHTAYQRARDLDAGFAVVGLSLAAYTEATT